MRPNISSHVSPLFSTSLTRLAIISACAALVACGGGGDDGEPAPSTGGGNTIQPETGGSTGNTGGSTGNTGGSTGNTGGGTGNTGGGTAEVNTGFAPEGGRVSITSDARRVTEYGTPSVVGYTLHNKDRSVTSIDGLLYTKDASGFLDLGSLQATLSNNAGDVSWGGSLATSGGRYFVDGEVLMGCAQTNSASTSVALSSAAKPATIAELSGKTYTEYSCSIEDFGTLTLNSNGSIGAGNDSLTPAQVTALFSSSGIDLGDVFIHAQGYLVGGKAVIVMKDVEDNGSRSITLAVQN